MKQIVCLLLMFFLLSSTGFAHPPDSIKAVYDKESGELSITIVHPTKDTDEHFISEILIKINGETRLTHKNLFQESNESQKALYRFTDIRTGDKIEITASCNVFGKKRITLEVEG